MEAAEECLVCGIAEIQQDKVNNVALLSVLAALLGQELGSTQLSTYALCQRCCHLLTEAAALQHRLDQVKQAILNVCRTVQYQDASSTSLATISCALPVPAQQATPGSTARVTSQYSTAHQANIVTEVSVSPPPAETSHGITEQTALIPCTNAAPTSSAQTSTVAVTALPGEPSTEAVTEATTGKVRRLPCPVCGKSVTARYLRAHQRQHSGERPFVCPLCPRSFAKSSDLTTHRRRHAGDRRHRCSLCPAAFFFPHELARHKHKHGETRPHLCPECGAGFFSRAGLLRHQRVDHAAHHANQSTEDVDSPQQKQCGHCGKKFACERSLRRHERAHAAGRRYMCEECGVTYRTSTALRFHTKRQHSGERPYRCEVCGRQFITRSVWLRHLRVHTGEAPFRCQFCGAAYKDKPKLKRHYSNKHAAEVAKVGAENLRYTAVATVETSGAARMEEETRQAELPHSLPGPMETCHISGIETGQVGQGHQAGQGQLVQGHQVSDPGWTQQWKEVVGAEVYGSASVGLAEHGNSSAMQPQEMAPVEMMQDSAVLPQGMLLEAQSALFSYF